MHVSDEKIRLLRAVKAGKSYSGVWAIENVDFDIIEGEIHGIAGENGSGKSTLCKAISGAIPLTSGQIFLDDEAQNFKHPSDALNKGISIVYQDTSLVPSMTVAQNVQLGREASLFGVRSINNDAQQLLQSMGFTHIEPSALVSSLSGAHKQMVEIARAVYRDARIIIFDEPTTALTPEEKQHFFHLMQLLAGRGVSIVFISHAIEELLEHSNRITVLRDGKHVVTDKGTAFTRESIVAHMVGRDAIQSSEDEPCSCSHRGATVKKKILSVENVSMPPTVKNMTFSIYAGEVTVLAGLVGAGRTEIAKIISGSFKRRFLNGGRIYLEGFPVRYRVPAQATRDGIVYVTEERRRDGFCELMGIDDNIYFGWLAARKWTSFLLSKRTRAKLADDWMRQLNVQTLSRNSLVKELSGGNQQKVVIARSLVQNPKVIIFDEPTRGVDVGAIDEIHRIIRDMASQGIAVMVISSYLPEVLKIADRILVARQGRIVEEFRSDDHPTEEVIMFAATH
jgi:ABC-type sugar transport system ATPase subunit